MLYRVSGIIITTLLSVLQHNSYPLLPPLSFSSLISPKSNTLASVLETIILSPRATKSSQIFQGNLLLSDNREKEVGTNEDILGFPEHYHDSPIRFKEVS